VLGRQVAHLLAQPGEQSSLNMAPTLEKLVTAPGHAYNNLR
jgi:hypothetical protein